MGVTPSCRSAFSFLALLLSQSTAIRAQQEVRLGSDAILTIRGILSATLFAQDARFSLGNGQQAEFVQSELADWWHGGDVRSTRLTSLAPARRARRSSRQRSISTGGWAGARGALTWWVTGIARI